MAVLPCSDFGCFQYRDYCYPDMPKAFSAALRYEMPTALNNNLIPYEIELYNSTTQSPDEYSPIIGTRYRFYTSTNLNTPTVVSVPRYFPKCFQTGYLYEAEPLQLHPYIIFDFLIAGFSVVFPALLIAFFASRVLKSIG